MEHIELVHKGTLQGEAVNVLRVVFGVRACYYLVTNLSALLKRPYGEQATCMRCLQTFANSSTVLAGHAARGKCADGPVVRLPKPEKAFVRFDAVAKQEMAPFVVYCDAVTDVAADGTHSLREIVACMQQAAMFPFRRPGPRVCQASQSQNSDL